MERYNHQQIEKKWQKIWRDKKTYQTTDAPTQKEKFYCLDMFPYPSGEGLHVGHPRGYTATDVYSRYLRLKGKIVLHPMGWDAFGLPAENYAIRHKIHPRIAVKKNIARFKKQIQSFGFSYDWSREINTTDPEYYKWTQWIFLKMFKRGLAYEKETPINWCPSCQTGLANEEVIQGKCERCKTQVTFKKIRQWHLRITRYADRLLKDLADLDWSESIKTMQRNWIGKSRGAVIKFKIAGSKNYLEVFTTRPDTLFGVTFMAVSPEHKLLQNADYKINNKKKIENYIQEAEQRKLSGKHKKEKSGVFTGLYAINPVNGEKIPVWVADYVSSEYGSGAIMAVPAHDRRDFEFAKKFNLPIKQVISGGKIKNQPYEGKGKMLNSAQYSGIDSVLGGKKIVGDLIKKNLAKRAVNYKLRDWVFSRQRYWGEPIPIVHCQKCGVVPVPEKDLPVKLPEVKDYEPSGDGKSPLAKIKDWLETSCPKCGGPAQRETNTMPQWAGSCWYYLAFIMRADSNFQIPIFKYKEKFDKWLPVDLYVGGAEHAVLHLLYARFWHKVLYDEKVVSTKEPFQKLINVGTILAPDGQKMSKSKGNVISPDSLIKKYGADSLRLYELFLGPFIQSVSWDKQGITGIRRFLERIWQMQLLVKPKTNPALEKNLNILIQEVEKDIQKFSFNTAIAKMMSFTNLVYDCKDIGKEQFKKFLLILSSFAPHISAELWTRGNKGMIEDNSYPHISGAIKQETAIIPVQINGKLRGQIEIDAQMKRGEIIKKAEIDTKIKKYLKGKKIAKRIYIPLKIINLVLE